MQYNFHDPIYSDDTLESSVTYEEILSIINSRHDYERFGDSDTY